MSKSFLAVFLTFIVTGICCTLTFVMVYFLILVPGQQNNTVYDYDTCVAAGNRVLKTYPGVCITQDGRSFTENLTDIGTVTGPGTAVATTSGTASSVGSTTGSQDKTISVKIHFNNVDSVEDFSQTTIVNRTVTVDSKVTPAIAAMNALISGPNTEEAGRGLYSLIKFTTTSNCGGSDFLITTMVNGTVTVKFCRQIPSSGIGMDARIMTVITNTIKANSSAIKVVVLDHNDNCFGDLSGMNQCKN